MSPILKHVTWPNAGGLGDPARVHILEDPTVAVRRVGLRERGGNCDPSSRTRRGFVKEAYVAGAHVAKHAVHRVLELRLRRRARDLLLMSLSKCGCIDVSAHELAIDDRENVTENGSALGFCRRIHGAHLCVAFAASITTAASPDTRMPLHSFGTATGPNCWRILCFARRRLSPTSAPVASCL